jgi:hypothetical protein
MHATFAINHAIIAVFYTDILIYGKSTRSSTYSTCSEKKNSNIISEPKRKYYEKIKYINKAVPCREITGRENKTRQGKAKHSAPGSSV